MNKHCNKCNTTKDVLLFSKDSKNGGYQNYCKTCQSEYKKNNKDKRRNNDYVRMYGITLSEYNTIRKEQHNCCKICGTHEHKQIHKKLVVDHCHSSGAVRGLLCNNCNTALGLLRDDTELFESCIKYLKESQHNE